MFVKVIVGLLLYTHGTLAFYNDALCK